MLIHGPLRCLFVILGKLWKRNKYNSVPNFLYSWTLTNFDDDTTRTIMDSFYPNWLIISWIYNQISGSFTVQNVLCCIPCCSGPTFTCLVWIIPLFSNFHIDLVLDFTFCSGPKLFINASWRLRLIKNTSSQVNSHFYIMMECS